MYYGYKKSPNGFPRMVSSYIYTKLRNKPWIMLTKSYLEKALRVELPYPWPEELEYTTKEGESVTIHRAVIKGVNGLESSYWALQPFTVAFANEIRDAIAESQDEYDEYDEDEIMRRDIAKMTRELFGSSPY